MTPARLRIVGKVEEHDLNEQISLYYFPLYEAAHDLDVPERWILQQLKHLKKPILRWGTWWFSPEDYHILRDRRDG